MEYWKTKVENIGTCRICLNILKSPLKLPCFNIICQEHIKNLQIAGDHLIKCPVCRSNHIIDELIKCEKLSNSLDHIFGEDKSKKLLNLELLIEKLDMKDEEVTLAKNALECFIYDHLKEIQNQVDLEREELKLKIDNDHSYLTKKIEELMNVLNESTNQIELKHDSRENLIEMFKKISKDNNNKQIEEFNERLEIEIKCRESKLKEYKEIKDLTALLYFDNNFLSKTNESILGSFVKKILPEKKLHLITLDNTYLRKWNAKTGVLLSKIEHKLSLGRIKCLSILSNNKALVPLNGILKYWDLDSLDAQPFIKKLEINIKVTCMADFLNKHIILGLNTGQISVYENENFKLVRKINAHFANRSVNSIIFYERDKFISCAHDNFIKIWSLASENYLKVINNSCGTNCLILSKDNLNLICGGNSGNIRIWNIINRTLIKNIEVNHALCFFEILDGNRLICAEKNGLIRVWNLFDYKCEKTLIGHSKKVETLKLINENQLMTYSHLDGTLKHWDLDKVECVKSFNITVSDCSKFY